MALKKLKWKNGVNFFWSALIPPVFIRLSAGVIWAVKVLFIFQNLFSCARYFKRINERYSVSLNVMNGIAIAMHILSARRSIEYALSPVNDSRGGLEVPIQMTFSHSSKAIICKMKAFAENQARKMKDIFWMEEEKEIEDEEDTGLDDGEEHPTTNRSSNVSMVIDLE